MTPVLLRGDGDGFELTFMPVLRITADEAYAAVRVSQAAAQSYKEKKPIHLDW